VRATRPLIYLAGGITGLTYGAATDWREYVRAALAPRILTASPMRAKQYILTLLGPETAIEEGTVREQYVAEHVISSRKGIISRDRWDVSTTDAVFMNLLGTTRVSIGSMIEAGWADAVRKPLIVVREPDNIHSHVLLDEIASYTVSTLDEGIDLVKALFSFDAR